MSDTYLRNLNLQIQVENMGLNSWGGEKRREPNRDFNLPSIETLLSKKDLINRQQQKQDQIQLYLEKEKRPVVVGGVEYKFNQVTEPQLVDVVKPQQDLETIKIEIGNKINDIEQEIINLKNIENGIELMKEEKSELENLLNVSNSEKNILRVEYDKLSNLNNAIESDLITYNQPLTTYDIEIASKDANTEQAIIDQLKEEKNKYFEKNKKFYLEKELMKNKNNREIKKKLDELRNIERYINITESKIDDIELADLPKSYADKSKIETKIQNINAEYNLLINDYDGKEIQLKKDMNENKRKVTEYGDELRRLNTGSFNLERFYNETDEEYADRLKINSQLPFDNSTTANLSNIERNNNFKENMRNLFNDDAFIEKILNHYKSGQEHYIYTFNQGFELFKKDYLNLYGFNNKDIIEEPLKFIELVDNFCKPNESGQPSFLLPSKDIELKQQFDPILEKLGDISKTFDPLEGLTEQDKTDRFLLLDQKSKSKLTIDELKEYNILKKDFDTNNAMKNLLSGLSPLLLDNNKIISLEGKQENQGNIMYFRYTDEDIKEYIKKTQQVKGIKEEIKEISNGQSPIILTSMSGIVGSFEEFVATPTNIRNMVLYIIGDLINEQFKKIVKSIISNFFRGEFTKYKFLEMLKLIEPNFTPTEIKDILILKTTGKKAKFGAGLKDDTPEYVQFGKYILLLKKLLLKNILSLHKKNHLKLSSFKNKKVSNEFVNLIFKLLDKQIITVQDLAILKIGEKEILDNLLGVCELNKKIITGSGLETLNKVKEKLNLIQGQIEAGNNNPIMKQELHDVLFQLVNLNAITERQARQHYKNICQDFF